MNVNNRIAGEALSLNPGTVDAVALQVERFGDDLKMERSNLLRTRLSVEEILLRWMEHFGEENAIAFPKDMSDAISLERLKTFEK